MNRPTGTPATEPHFPGTKSASRGAVSTQDRDTKEEAALEYGEEGDGQVVRVGAVWQVPGGVKDGAARR